jgi:tetratricopeptide (TPR) repeat protein
MNNPPKIDLSDLVIGDWFYTSDNDQIELYQLLEIQTAFLVKAYWPMTTDTAFEAADLRTACTHFDAKDKALFYLKTGELSTTDLQEIAQYKRIVEGKKAREEHFQSLVLEANNSIATNEFSKALDLLTEAAPFAKLDISIYQKRGFCAFHLGKYYEAIADFEYVLSQTNDQESLQLCITAYEQVGNVEKANEKRNFLKV